MTTEKRNPRSYKVVDSVYSMATKRAIDNGLFLAEIVEQFVKDYSNGLHTKYHSIIVKKRKQKS